MKVATAENSRDNNVDPNVILAEYKQTIATTSLNITTTKRVTPDVKVDLLVYHEDFEPNKEFHLLTSNFDYL